MGRFEWPDGRSFEGRYECDKKHGPGVLCWADGTKCVGVWRLGRLHGAGTRITPDGSARRGKWKGGVLESWTDPVSDSETKGRGTATQESDAMRDCSTCG